MRTGHPADTATPFERLLDDVLARPAGERAAFVDALANVDAATRERLLRAIEQQARIEQVGAFFLERLAAAPASRADAAASALRPAPARIGPYRILRKLGEGGMGIVYLAARGDDALRQQVALKVIHGGHGIGNARERFEQERQILAACNHPGIAKMFDWGQTDAGDPYYTMEFVDGAPIIDFCRERLHTVEARVDLLIRVAGALAHAHQNLIVHRDIKPSNILVRSVEDVKLLDFGIAKLVDQDLNPGFTGTALAPMTIEYAAPEQVSNRPITVATDVYQFAVLCFRVLAGALPYEADPASTYDWLRAVAEHEPRTLAAALAAGAGGSWSPEANLARVRRRLTRDLDAILRKAMAKDPADRYAGMDALIDDLQRYLAGRPVRARRAGGAYRTMRFASRHKAACAGVLAAIVLIALGVNRVRVERDHALAAERQQQDMAEAGSDVTQILIQLLASDASKDSAGRLEPQQFLDGFRERIANDPPQSSQERAALLQLAANVFDSTGRWKDALAMLQEKVALERAAGPARAYLLVQTLSRVGNTQSQTGDYPGADRAAREAEQVFDAQSADLSLDRLHAARQLGAALVTLGHNREAQKYLGEADRISEAAFGGYTRDRSWALWDQARGLARWHRFDAAVPKYEQALTVMTKILGPDHKLLGMAQTERGKVLARSGAAGQAYELCSRYVPDGANRGVPGLIVADAHECRSLAAEIAGRLADAVAEQETAAATIRATEGEGSPWSLISAARIAQLELERGEVARGERELRAAIGAQERVLNPHSPELAQARLALAQHLVANGRLDEAAPLLDAAQAAYDDDYGPDTDVVAYVRIVRADLLRRSGARAAAQRLLDAAAGEGSGGKSVFAAERFAAAEEVGAALAAEAGDAAAVLRHRERAVQIREAFYGRAHFRVAMAQLALAEALSATGREQDARTLSAAAMPVLRANLSAQSPYLAEAGSSSRRME